MLTLNRKEQTVLKASLELGDVDLHWHHQYNGDCMEEQQGLERVKDCCQHSETAYPVTACEIFD